MIKKNKTKLIFFLSVFLSAIALAQQCFYSWTQVPPFYISGVTGVTSEKFDFNGREITVESSDGKNISEENFRNEQGQRYKKISKGTVVTLDFEDEIDKLRFARKIAKKDKFFVPVKVEDNNKTIVKFKTKNDQARYVNKGDKGMLWSRSMEAFGKDHSFLVNKDTVLTNLRGTAFQLPPSTALIPIISDEGKYKVYKCCEETEGKFDCSSTYLYNSMNSKGQITAKELKIDNQCIDNFNVVRNEDVEDLSNFMQKIGLTGSYKPSDLEYNDFGRVKMPLIKTGKANISGISPDGSFVHYQGTDPLDTDVWGKTEVICSINLMAKRFKDKCLDIFPNQQTRCTMQIGDVGYVTPGKLARKYLKENNGKYLDPLGHQTHHSGECIDIRPLRNDNKHEGVTYFDSKYDSRLTQLLVNISLQTGANQGNLHFNDPNIKNTSGRVIKGHHNHLHVCFNNVKRKNNCEQLKNYKEDEALRTRQLAEIKQLTNTSQRDYKPLALKAKDDDGKEISTPVKERRSYLSTNVNVNQSAWNKNIDSNVLNLIDSTDYQKPQDCQKPQGQCNTSKLSKNDRRVKPILKWVSEAANRFGVSPGLLMGILHAESTFNPLEHNTSGENSKGMAQFASAYDASKYNLNYNAPKPSASVVYTEAYNRPDSSGKYPIWSPKGSIFALAKKMRALKDRAVYMPTYNQDGTLNKNKKIDISHVYKRSDIRTARYLAGIHNRGTMSLYSIAEYYRQNKKLPPDYGTAWETKRLTASNAKDRLGNTIGRTSKKQILNNEVLNRCYVYKIAGLCGDSSNNSFFEYYNKYFD